VEICSCQSDEHCGDVQANPQGTGETERGLQCDYSEESEMIDLTDPLIWAFVLGVVLMVM
jgi:hypothetical protein